MKCDASYFTVAIDISIISLKEVSWWGSGGIYIYIFGISAELRRRRPDILSPPASKQYWAWESTETIAIFIYPIQYLFILLRMKLRMKSSIAVQTKQT